MRKRKSGRKFGRKRAQRNALLFGIAESVFRHNRVRTTEARAKEARRIVERAVTLGKTGTLASRRRLARSFSPAAVKRVTDEIAPRYANRRGGSTRIVKLPRRGGDSAPMAYLELVE